MNRIRVSVILATWVVILLANAAWADDAVGKQRVLVLPFTVLNGTAEQAWMSKAVQDNTVVELGRSAQYTPVAHAAARPDADAAVAARLGRMANAPYALYGSVQVVGSSLRITAQVLNSKTNDVIITASSTGPASELLRLEDDIVQQLRVAVQPPVAAGQAPGVQPVGQAPAAQPVPAAQQAPAAQPAPAQQPQRIVVVVVNQQPQLPVPSDVPDLSLAAQTVQNTYPALGPYGYGYGNPYMSYPYYPSYGYGYGGYGYGGCRFGCVPQFALIRSTGPSYGPLTPGPQATMGVPNLSALDNFNRHPSELPAHGTVMTVSAPRTRH